MPVSADPIVPATPESSVDPIRIPVIVEVELSSGSVSSLSNSWESPTEREMVASSLTASVSFTAVISSSTPATVIVKVAVSVSVPSETV